MEFSALRRPTSVNDALSNLQASSQQSRLHDEISSTHTVCAEGVLEGLDVGVGESTRLRSGFPIGQNRAEKIHVVHTEQQFGQPWQLEQKYVPDTEQNHIDQNITTQTTVLVETAS